MIQLLVMIVTFGIGFWARSYRRQITRDIRSNTVMPSGSTFGSYSGSTNGSFGDAFCNSGCPKKTPRTYVAPPVKPTEVHTNPYLD